MSRQTLIVAALVAAAAPAYAQNALGDGTALDYNLLVGGNRINSPVRNLNAAMRYQNSIVTGNAPGGMSFRGDIDYRAPGDFTGGQGTLFDTGDSSGQLVYEFGRDSLYSGLAGRGIRGTEALQYQFQLMTGGAGNTNLRGPLTLPKPMASATGTNLAPGRPPQFQLGEPEAPLQIATPDLDPDYDRRGTLLENFRATSSVNADNALRPYIVDERVDEQGRQVTTTASTLLGVNRIAAPPADRKVDRAVEPTKPESEVEPAKPETQVGPTRPDLTNPDLPDEGVEPSAGEGPSTYDDLLRRLENFETPDANDDSTWRDRLLETRRAIIGAKDADEEEETDVAPWMVDMIKRAGGTIEQLAPVGIGGVDAYTVNMNSGQQLLAQGRYFDAEERFARALTARPGDAMAQIGRAHAEIGAGMYLSAVFNLRQLLSENPQLIGAKYASELLPKSERLDHAKADLRERIADERSGLPIEAALLLAYVGYQTNDMAAVNEGLRKAADFAEQGDDDQLARLVELVEAVWTGAADTDR